MVTVEDSLKHRMELPFVAYCDFETTTTNDCMLNSEDCKVFPLSYVIIFAFHPELNLEKVIGERSFWHSLEKLVNVGYLAQNMLEYIDMVTARQLKDCIIRVSQRKDKQAIGEIFSIELIFAANWLMCWFVKTFKS